MKTKKQDLTDFSRSYLAISSSLVSSAGRVYEQIVFVEHRTAEDFLATKEYLYRRWMFSRPGWLKTILLVLLMTMAAVSAFAADRLEVTSIAIGKAHVVRLESIKGTPPFAYQWYKNDVAIPGATGETLAFPALALTDVGIYTVQVTNKAGTTRSDAAVFYTVTGPAGAILVIAKPVAAAPVPTVP